MTDSHLGDWFDDFRSHKLPTYRGALGLEADRLWWLRIDVQQDRGSHAVVDGNHIGLILHRRTRQNLVPRGIQNVMESAVDFITNSVVIDVMGQEGLAWVPWLTGLFFSSSSTICSRSFPSSRCLRRPELASLSPSLDRLRHLYRGRYQEARFWRLF